MAQTRQRAADQDKLAMYVLGANWCHDSTDFAALLEDSAVAPQIEQGYEVQFINVGYLQYIREYVSLYNVPVIYGTPTVMIVDPTTNHLLNQSSLPYWRNASELGTQDARAYFDQFKPEHAPPLTPRLSPALRQSLAAIDQFERDQAQRIYRAYQVLGPMLKDLEAGQPAAEFEQQWDNLAKMRGALPTDLSQLRESARQQDEQGITDIQLQFPHYSLFID
jgi:hypothetical protein